MQKIYIVTDLGPGDGGKGSVVHALSCKVKASVIIKRGGAQGSHGVRTSRGESFNFSQWGCGTFEHVPTFLSDQLVISPIGLANESEALKKVGINNPYAHITADPSCICATPFHRISSRLEELKLGENPRGTIGSGVGRAYRMYSTMGNDITLRAKELTDRDAIMRKVARQADYYRDQYLSHKWIATCHDDAELISENLNLLDDDGYITYIVDLFEDVGKKLRLQSLDEVLKKDGSAIVECSHGVLTDAETGLKPHTSGIRTLPKFTEKMIRDTGYDGKITHLAVHRAYEIRHGAGPMPTYDKNFTKQMLPGSHKDENRWQGIVRAGALDLNLLKYALESSKDTPLEGICLTWFDQLLACGKRWPICTSYKNSPKPGENYTEFLKTAEPIIEEYEIHEPLFDFVNEVLQNKLQIPIVTLSIGPTEADKIFGSTIKL